MEEFCTIIGNGDFAQLNNDYVTPDGYTIPEGFIWDGMTMNKVACIEKFGDRVDKLSIEHDYAYVYEGDIPGFERKLTRKEVDRRFLSNLILNTDIKLPHAIYIYLLVRMFGGVKWPGKKTELLTKK